MKRSKNIKTQSKSTATEFSVLRAAAASKVEVIALRGGFDLRNPERVPTKIPLEDASFRERLEKAFHNYNLDALIQFIRHNRDDVTSFADEYGNSLLFRASCLKRSTDAQAVCKLLLQLGVPSNGPPNRNQRTPLIEMVRNRPAFHNKVAALFKRTVNHQDSEGRTALTYAVEGAGMFGSRKGSIPIISTLLALGADLQLATKRGKTALDFATKPNDTKINEDVVRLIKMKLRNL